MLPVSFVIHSVASALPRSFVGCLSSQNSVQLASSSIVLSCSSLRGYEGSPFSVFPSGVITIDIGGVF